MKRVVAVLRPPVVADLQAALDDEFPDLGMTTEWAEGYGRQKGHTEIYRGSTYAIDFVPKLRIEIVCGDLEADDIVELVVTTARTGSIGDGKVWTQPINTALDIGNPKHGQ